MRWIGYRCANGSFNKYSESDDVKAVRATFQQGAGQLRVHFCISRVCVHGHQCVSAVRKAV